MATIQKIIKPYHDKTCLFKNHTQKLISRYFVFYNRNVKPSKALTSFYILSKLRLFFFKFYISLMNLKTSDFKADVYKLRIIHILLRQQCVISLKSYHHNLHYIKPSHTHDNKKLGFLKRLKVFNSMYSSSVQCCDNANINIYFLNIGSHSGNGRIRLELNINSILFNPYSTMQCITSA